MSKLFAGVGNEDPMDFEAALELFDDAAYTWISEDGAMTSVVTGEREISSEGPDMS